MDSFVHSHQTSVVYQVKYLQLTQGLQVLHVMVIVLSARNEKRSTGNTFNSMCNEALDAFGIIGHIEKEKFKENC